MPEQRPKMMIYTLLRSLSARVCVRFRSDSSITIESQANQFQAHISQPNIKTCRDAARANACQIEHTCH